MRLSPIRPVEKRESDSFFNIIPPNEWVAWLTNSKGWPQYIGSGKTAKEAVENVKNLMRKDIESCIVDLWKEDGSPDKYGVQDKLDTL